MLNFIEVMLDDNTKIYLETAKEDIKKNKNEAFVPIANYGKIVEKSKEFLDNSFAQIKAFSSGIVNSIKSLDAAPDEFEVSFSVKFSADAGIIISSVSSEASITVKLKWTNS